MKTIKDFGTNYKERVTNAIRSLKNGRGVILLDSRERENEADLIFPASTISEADMALMIRECSGIVCLCLTSNISTKLGLYPMVANNTSKNQTAFTISIEAKEGVKTGVSAKDRVTTIKTAISPSATPDDLSHPGHIFPLIAKENGVFERKGHTEGSVDLIKLSNLGEASVLSELTNPDGTMASEQEAIHFAQKHNLPVVQVGDIYKYRLCSTSIIKRGETALLPTDYGFFKTIPYKDLINNLEHLVLLKGTWCEDDEVLVRIHSSCATGDIFSSSRCDCGQQLRKSIDMIEKAGKGVVVYLNQEGRGIGLCNKIHAYKLQDEGLDTIEANIALGFKADEREYSVGASILKDLGIKNIQLITNNPKKTEALQEFGLNVTRNIPIIIPPNKYNDSYLKTKKEKMGHLL